MSCCAHRNILIIMSVLFMETRLGQAAPCFVAAEAIPAACLPCRRDESGCWGTLWGPLTRHAQRKPQLPKTAQGGFLFLWAVLSCLSGPGGLSCRFVLSCLFSPGGLLIPPNFPREFFLGGKRVPAVGAGPRGPRPRPQGPPAMASWAPCTAMASFVCLFRSGDPRPVFLSVFVLRGLQSILVCVFLVSPCCVRRERLSLVPD